MSLPPTGAGAGVVQVPVVLTAFGASPTPAQATVVDQGAGRRVVRALGGLGACWGLALGSVAIPVAHFVLVPTFAVAGLVVAVLRAREDRRLVRVTGTCPRCGAAIALAARGRFQVDRVLHCPHCHQVLRLSAAGAPDHPNLVQGSP
jgi:ribosomal protein S27AE